MKKFLQSDFFYYFKHDKVAIFSFCVLALIILAALFAPVIAPHNPYDLSTIDIMDSELAPIGLNGYDERFLLGTDEQGRDILSTILYGLRTSLTIGFFAVLAQMILGVLIGLLSAYYGGWVDNLLMRIADIQLSFSTLMVAIIISAIFKTLFGTAFFADNAIIILIIIIGIAEWPQYARAIRASALAEKSKEYIEAAKVMGLPPKRIMFKHMLPNCLSPILVISTVQIANAIMSEAALSFLGLGMPPDKPSLGSLISNGFNYISSGSWWITLFPGIMLIILTLVVNLLGDWLRDVFNPKLYKG
ncbi:ABC transporter permease [Basilea psittacipulmonis]|uniref:ABC transporter permease n=1 Tax=Basilea psittacipulmonis DSM 24701 TaxID=1072685 RepID=A0A077DI70_9BURK|nr:ABC transporter permease [Basilea psittacipulmonis]AIL32853.1 ABC transporter permease [Basilea psittacipulmonis DSM 24701]